MKCSAYGANFYEGTYLLDGTALTLSVTCGNGECCSITSTTQEWKVKEITETTLVMTLKGEVVERTRAAGTAGDIRGLWTREDGQSFEFRGDGTFTGAEDSTCTAPLPCGAVPGAGNPALGRLLVGLFQVVIPLLLLLWLGRRTRRPCP